MRRVLATLPAELKPSAFRRRQPRTAQTLDEICLSTLVLPI